MKEMDKVQQKLVMIFWSGQAESWMQQIHDMLKSMQLSYGSDVLFVVLIEVEIYKIHL